MVTFLELEDKTKDVKGSYLVVTPFENYFSCEYLNIEKNTFIRRLFGSKYKFTTYYRYLSGDNYSKELEIKNLPFKSYFSMLEDRNSFVLIVNKNGNVFPISDYRKIKVDFLTCSTKEFWIDIYLFLGKENFIKFFEQNITIVNNSKEYIDVRVPHIICDSIER